MSTTGKDIGALFVQLQRAKRHRFPELRGQITDDALDRPGVYIVYTPRSERVFYVGKTSRSTLRQRLKGHLFGRSKHHGAKWRHYQFRCLAVRSARHRTLLEGYAIGMLCPKYLPTGAIKRSSPQSK
jgi:excinuclease UvrABC nuclease subunit